MSVKCEVTGGAMTLRFTLLPGRFRRVLIPWLFSLAVPGHLSAQSCAPPPLGIAHWWAGDGNPDDLRGGNPGSLEGAVSFAAGQVGQAFDFQGGVLRIPNRADLESQHFTIETWVFPRSVGSAADVIGPVIISKDITAAAPTISYSLAGPGTSGRFRASVGLTNSTDPAVVSTHTFAFNLFYHVAMTWDGGGTNELRLYVNGALEGSVSIGPETVLYEGTDVGIGRHPIFGGRQFDGLIDEIAFYARALTAAEIESIYLAGPSGKCRPPAPVCTPPSSNLAHWWPGDGNSDDLVGGDPGSLEGAVFFATGKVGQGFDFQGGILRIPNSPALESQQFTIETWLFARSSGSYHDEIGPVVVSKDITASAPTISYSLAGPSFTGPAGRFRASVGLTDGTDPHVFSEHSFAFNAFHHVAMTWDGSELRLFVNGTLEGSASLGPKTILFQGTEVGVGRHPLFGGRTFDGRIDEVTIFDRALSGVEIEAIYVAGTEGKCRQANTPAGSGVPVEPGSGVSLTFSNVIVGGNTTVESLSAAPDPPLGFKIGNPPTFYEVATTAEFSGTVEVCVHYPGISFGNESKLKLFHYENGTWVNVTTSLDTANDVICGAVSGFSPLAVLEPEDTDQDGLPDADEITFGTNPLISDTDGDGLLDGTEVDIAEGSGCPSPMVFDSDSDGLGDGAEVLTHATNPCSVDTDGDSIPDGVDPFPLDPGGTQGYVEAQLRDLAAFIDAVTVSKFTGPNTNANAGRRTALSNRATAAAKETATGNYAAAIEVLESLLDRVDGTQPPEDWIVAGDERSQVAQTASDMITLLGYL